MNKFLKSVGYDATKQTTVRTELVAGVVTFLSMAYILTVNPNQIFGSTANVYWSSLTKILIPARNLLKVGGHMVCLIKPQFEAGKDKVGKNGVVREKSIHQEVIGKIVDFATMVGFVVEDLEYSPIKGPEGNIEYLIHITKEKEPAEEVLARTESEAEGALKELIENKTGASHDEVWKQLIKATVEASHETLSDLHESTKR